MKISHNWLREYVAVRLKPTQLAERLSMLGLEVESHEDLSAKFDGFVVGEVNRKQQHPNADRLTICTVDVGSERLDIVCGAPNVEVGQKVAVARIGATIPHNQHDPDAGPFTLDAATIRGVASNGMICSAFELGVGEDREGILVLDPKAKVGMPLSKVLGRTDVIYEMEITANRGDWMSYIGVAREVAAITGTRASLPKVVIRESSDPAAKHAKIRIEDTVKCRRYSSRIVRNISVGPSPRWLQDRLLSVGVRPINNIVDVTNFVMLETGQPLHAFDYDALAGHTIVVKCAGERERFRTLDGKERVLTSDTLMICDAVRSVAIAGVMGGENTGISESTTSVLLESANFAQSSIRQTAKYLGLSTDASQRFERGVDIEMTLYAVNRAAQLLQDLAGGEVLKGVIDIYPRKVKRKSIRLRAARVNDILGTNLTLREIVSLLKRLQLEPVSRQKDSVVIRIPTFRADLEQEIDLIEEVARVYGYDRIETKTRTTVDFSKPLVTTGFRDVLREYLIGAGFNEMVTFSLQDMRSIALSGGHPVEVLNPVSADAVALRTSLVAGAIEVVKHNRSHGEKDLRLFEIGTVFERKVSSKEESLEGYHEEERVILVLTGCRVPAVFGAERRLTDFFEMKGEVEALLAKFNLDKKSFISYDSASALIESGLAVEINGTYAGFLGKITKSLAQEFDIEDEVFICELKTAVLSENWKTDRKLSALPRYPSVSRDLAFVVEATVTQERVERSIREAGGELLSKLRLFDVYVGDQVGPGKKSLAYSLELQPLERTLTDREADEVVRRIVAHVEATCGARLRG